MLRHTFSPQPMSAHDAVKHQPSMQMGGPPAARRDSPPHTVGVCEGAAAQLCCTRTLAALSPLLDAGSDASWCGNASWVTPNGEWQSADLPRVGRGCLLGQLASAGSARVSWVSQRQLGHPASAGSPRVSWAGVTPRQHIHTGIFRGKAKTSQGLKTHLF